MMQAANLSRLNNAEAALLAQAFEAFSQSSARLEEKYQALLKETEVLREQLREKDEAMKRSERLAMLGETAAGIAHEVRNPLGSIKLFTSLLRQDLTGQTQELELIDHIERSVTTLDHAVSNILQFARGQKTEFAPLNINAALSGELENLIRLPGCSTHIVSHLRGSPFIHGNEHDLKRAFHNLILNSLQAQRFAGEIRIETSDTDGQRLQIKISDKGPGIPEDMLERIFEPFITTKNEGTGLGLAIVRKIVEQHGGAISAANFGGACFTVILPRQVDGAGKSNDIRER